MSIAGISVADMLTFIERVGFPVTLVFVLLWKVIPALDSIKEAMWALSDVDKIHARMQKPLDEHAAKIIEDVGHDTRAALQPVLLAIKKLDRS